MFDVLSVFGVSVDVHINHREKDGYGLQMVVIEDLFKRGTQLIITTDSGISNAKEIARANELGMDVIITDHHTVPESPSDLPNAHAILHPLVRAERYPFKHLSGGGVAFKLVQALIRADFDPDFAALRETLRDADNRLILWEAYEKWLLDLVCLSTVGDCMPLVGENRAFVMYGLIVLSKTKRLGLQSLLAQLSGRVKQLTPHTIGFLIGPRLNAASRMEHGKIAFDLLTARYETDASTLAGVLEQKNIERQKLTERIFSEAKELLNEQIDKPILVAHSDTWPLGLLGLVAGKLVHFFQKPVVLMTSVNGPIAGAARSNEHVHIANAFASMSDYFERFGGHAVAGGFGVKKGVPPEVIAQALHAYGREHGVPDASSPPSVMIDSVARFSELSLELVKQLKLLEPHGQGNAKPLFLVSGATVIDMRTVGTTGKHLKLTLQQDGLLRKAIGFGHGARIEELTVGARLDCVLEIEENEWNGMREVQLTLRDFHCVHTELQPVAVSKSASRMTQPL